MIREEISELELFMVERKEAVPEVATSMSFSISKDRLLGGLDSLLE